MESCYEKAAMNLTQRLRNREFEFTQPITKLLYYWFERKVCELALRRRPPKVSGPNLLNLGCGPHIYAGWINADDYAVKRRFRDQKFRPNWNLDITHRWKCPNDYWDGIFSEHVLEHITYSEALFVLEECLRTLRPGAWLRISVPDLRKYVEYYHGRQGESARLGVFPSPALAVSYLTQMHLHRSTWDGILMAEVLHQIGFANVSVVAFGCGSDVRLIKDDAEKADESVYIEARKRS